MQIDLVIDCALDVKLLKSSTLKLKIFVCVCMCVCVCVQIMVCPNNYLCKEAVKTSEIGLSATFLQHNIIIIAS